MANEATVSVSLKYESGSLPKINESYGGIQIDVTGNNTLRHVQNIGTSEEAITLGDVAAGGLMLLKNLDATNYVEIRPNTGVADLIKLKAGEPALFRTASDATPYAIANTAAVDLLVVIIDD